MAAFVARAGASDHLMATDSATHYAQRYLPEKASRTYRAHVITKYAILREYELSAAHVRGKPTLL